MSLGDKSRSQPRNRMIESNCMANIWETGKQGKDIKCNSFVVPFAGEHLTSLSRARETCDTAREDEKEEDIHLIFGAEHK